MPGNFLELPGIRGRRRGDLNPITGSLLESAYPLQIKGSRAIGDAKNDLAETALQGVVKLYIPPVGGPISETARVTCWNEEKPRTYL